METFEYVVMYEGFVNDCVYGIVEPMSPFQNVTYSFYVNQICSWSRYTEILSKKRTEK